jgi:hypothetical protein
LYGHTNVTGVTAIGAQAGFGPANGGGGAHYCTWIGYYNGYNITSGRFNIGLGAYVNVSDPAGYGQLNIGNVLYGTNLYQTASVSATPTTNGRIGILVAAPQSTLDVAGDIRASTTITSTNGYVMTQLPWIPTNSIPASASGITNYVLLCLSNTVAGTTGGPHFIATNYTAAGSFIILKPTFTQTTWP